MMKMGLCVLLIVLAFGTGVCFAEPDIPNLVGTWSVQAEGTVLPKGSVPWELTHYKGEFGAITASIIVNEQRGRIFHGTFRSLKATENIIGVIGWDNKSISIVDQDGFVDGMLVNNDTISYIYRHITPNDSVVAAGTCTRKK